MIIVETDQCLADHSYGSLDFAEVGEELAGRSQLYHTLQKGLMLFSGPKIEVFEGLKKRPELNKPIPSRSRASISNNIIVAELKLPSLHHGLKGTHQGREHISKEIFGSAWLQIPG